MARLTPLALALLAALADGMGAHRPAFYLLLVALPLAAWIGLERFGALVDALEGEGVERAALELGVAALAVGLLALGEAARAPQLAGGTLPRLALTALAGALLALALEAMAGLVGGDVRARREASR